MKNNIQLLDCTLRDGAYIVDSKFGTPSIMGIIKKLQDANVDIIECGWLKNSPHQEGTTFYNVPSDLEQYFVEKKTDLIYTVMIDWDRYDLDQLPPCDHKSIDGIRVVFPREKFREGVAVGKEIAKKGYLVYYQAANTLAYDNEALLELAEVVNEAKPVALSVVDTFGAMFAEDLERITKILNEELNPDIALGFHSHNNQQMSFSLSMQFVDLLKHSGRIAMLDGSLCGMGRGAGNASTEQLTGYINKRFNGNYDLNVIMDAIDLYMGYFQKNYTWGYSTQYLIAGMYCTHVNNIAYLQKNHRVSFLEMKNIIESLSADDRRKYDYDLLEEKYLSYQDKHVDDSAVRALLSATMAKRPVLLLAPGATISKEMHTIENYIAEKNPVVIGVNHVYPDFDCDYLFFSNPQRYEYAKDVHKEELLNSKRLLLSNISSVADDNEEIINFNLLVKRGWEHFDNGMIMCLRLMNKLGVNEVALAGFDGFNSTYAESYFDTSLPEQVPEAELWKLNREVMDMFDDLVKSCTKMQISFVTKSLYDVSKK